MAIATLLAACDVKDPIYNTPHPNTGTVTLTTDWSGIGEGLTAPAQYKVVAGDFNATCNGTTNALNNQFTPGTHNLYAYNTPEHIAVEGTTASVEAVTSPAGQSGTFIHNAPGWLFTSATEARIEADTDHDFTAVMQQQVRQLTLIIEPTGGTTDRIERIEGCLTGAASTLDFADGGATHALPANVELHFARIASGTDAGKWTATVRLLGTAGTEQRLHAQIHFANNSPAAITLDSDLTTELAGFNGNKRTPLTLGGRMVETPTEAGFGATITNWTPVTGSGTAD